MSASTFTFDTLVYAKRLVQAGCNKELAEEFAEAQADIMTQLVENTLVTKADLRELEYKLEHRMDKLENKIDKLENNIDKLSYELILKLGGLMVVLIGVSTALLGFLMKIH